MMTKHHFQLVWAEAQQTLKLAYPIIASQVGQILLGLIDTLMIGRLGVVPLGASAFATSIFSIFLVFGFGISSCISPMVARADGAQQKRECGEILRHGIVFVLLFGILLALCIEVVSKYLNLFDQTPEVALQAKDYLIVLGWSLIPALIFQGLRQFTEALSRPLIPMMIMLAAVFLNTFLNWIWIYGNWGSEAYGLVGAAWATLVTRVLMMLVLAWFVLKSVRFEEYLPTHWFVKLKSKILREMFKLGVPSALQTLFEVGAFCFAAIMIGWISAASLAAHQIALSVVAMTFMVTLGLSFATSIRVSNALGREDFIAARRVGFGGIALGGAIMGIFGIFILIANRWLPLAYISDADVIVIASHLLIIGAFFQIFDGVQGVAIGALRGMHDVKLPTIITFVCYWVVAIPLVYFLGFTLKMDALGVWIGLSIGLIAAAATLTARFHVLTRKKILARV